MKRKDISRESQQAFHPGPEQKPGISIHEQLAETIAKHKKLLQKHLMPFVEKTDIHKELEITIAAYRQTLASAREKELLRNTWLILPKHFAA